MTSALDALINKYGELNTAYGKLTKEELFNFANILNNTQVLDIDTSKKGWYLKIPKVLCFDENVDPQQDPAKTVPQELPKSGNDVDTSKSQWYLEIPKAVTAIQWTGNNQQAMEDFCNNGRYRISDQGDGTLKLADSTGASIINQGDYVVSLKSGFSIYKADEFVKEYQYIQKNSDAEQPPDGFETESSNELLPPPPGSELAQFSSPIKNVYNKIKKFNNKMGIERFNSNKIPDTGKRILNALPGQNNNFALNPGVQEFIRSNVSSAVTGAMNNTLNKGIDKVKKIIPKTNKHYSMNEIVSKILETPEVENNTPESEELKHLDQVNSDLGKNELEKTESLLKSIVSNIPSEKLAEKGINNNISVTKIFNEEN